jgi:hypothetical protein
MLSEPSRASKRSIREQNASEQYECLGRFVEAFESMVSTVRSACINLLSANTQYARWMQIPFYHHSMTAQPLFDIMRGIIAEMLKDEKFRKAQRVDESDYRAFLGVLAWIATEYGKLTSKRNDLLHGTWIVGFYGLPDEATSEFAIIRHKINSDGLAVPTDLPKDAEMLRHLARRCEGTHRWISALNDCLPRSLNKKKMKKTFRLNGKQWEKSWPYATTLPAP